MVKWHHTPYYHQFAESTDPKGHDLWVSSLLSDSGHQSGAHVHRAAWFIPTDCPQLLQLPVPRPGMHGWGESTNTPQNRWLMEFPSKVTKKARHAVPDPAGVANRISANASMKELQGETARCKPQLLIWADINKLERRFLAPLIGPCSLDDPDEDYCRFQKAATKIRQAEWRQAGAVALGQTDAAAAAAVWENHNEPLWRRPNTDWPVDRLHTALPQHNASAAHQACGSSAKVNLHWHRLEQILSGNRAIKSH